MMNGYGAILKYELNPISGCHLINELRDKRETGFSIYYSQGSYRHHCSYRHHYIFTYQHLNLKYIMVTDDLGKDPSFIMFDYYIGFRNYSMKELSDLFFSTNEYNINFTDLLPKVLCSIVETYLFNDIYGFFHEILNMILANFELYRLFPNFKFPEVIK